MTNRSTTLLNFFSSSKFASIHTTWEIAVAEIDGRSDYESTLVIVNDRAGMPQYCRVDLPSVWRGESSVLSGTPLQTEPSPCNYESLKNAKHP